MNIKVSVNNKYQTEKCPLSISSRTSNQTTSSSLHFSTPLFHLLPPYPLLITTKINKQIAHSSATTIINKNSNPSTTHPKSNPFPSLLPSSLSLSLYNPTTTSLQPPSSPPFLLPNSLSNSPPPPINPPRASSPASISPSSNSPWVEKQSPITSTPTQHPKISSISCITTLTKNITKKLWR